MGEMKLFQEMAFKDDDKIQPRLVKWLLMEPKDGVCKYDLLESDLDDSLESSSSSSDTIDDVSSSPSSSLSSSSSPLFQLSELMAQLPIKKGLSKFYHGKSESFASLNDVENIEDLAKKGKYFCRSRSRKSYVDQGPKRLSPKATIAKNKKGPSSCCSTTGVVGVQYIFQ